MVLAFSGKIGSGKTTLTTMLAVRLGWPRVSFGEYVRQLAIQRQLEPTRQVLQALGETLLDESIEEFCKRVIAQADWQATGNLLIDGVRHISVLDQLESLVHPHQLNHVHLTLGEHERAARLVGRLEDVAQIESHSTEVEVPVLLPAKADLVIDGFVDVEKNVAFIQDWLSQQR